MAEVTREELKARYPAYAWMIDEPEIGQILLDAYRDKLTDGAIQVKIMESTWWQTHSATVRDYHTLANTDPQSFWQAVQVKADWITDKISKMGLDMTPEQIYEAAKAALYYGWSDADLQRSLVYQGGGTFSDRSFTQSRIKELASSYWINLAPEQVSDWTAKISSGQYTEQNFAAQLQAWSKTLFPHLAQEIDSGMTLNDYSAPYRQQIASLLEINPNDVDFANNPRYRQVVDYVDSTGNHRGMSLTEAERYLKSMPEWQETKNGRDTTASTVDLLLHRLGQVA